MIEISAILLLLIFIAWILCHIGGRPGPRVLEKPSSGAPPDPPKGQGVRSEHPGLPALPREGGPICRVTRPMFPPSYSCDAQKIRRILEESIPPLTFPPRARVDLTPSVDWDNLECDLREDLLRALEMAAFGPRLPQDPPQDPEIRKEDQDAG